MSADDSANPTEVIYNRSLVLNGPKRNEILKLWEVKKYGTDSYGDPDFVSIYGMKPDDWFARGVRILGRTAVECTPDCLAKVIAEDIAKVARTASESTTALVIDPFAGSGNTLFWILTCVENSKGIGVELDDQIFALSRQNIASMRAPIEYLLEDYAAALKQIELKADQLLVVFVAPPWGGALNHTTGLDLRRTTPPITEIVDAFKRHFAGSNCLFAVQVYQTLEPRGLEELRSRFDWHAIHTYELNASGQNHGILLGTCGWIP